MKILELSKIHYILLGLLLFVQCSSFATHIIGGEITYQLLDRNTNSYSVSAQIFFDCENGSQNAIDSDVEIIISQWDLITGAFLGDFTLNTVGQNRVTASEEYACINDPGNICVTAYQYSGIANIDPGDNGVILAWQRCCRNDIIDNIVDPGSTGFTAWTAIPPAEIENSSPRFTSIPPIYICTSAPLDIEQSATDLDGDSLAYKLITPNIGGASFPNTRVRPNSVLSYDRPPFGQIIWENNFSSTNPIPGNPSLNYDENTGRITITPTRTGQYVIGLMVEEWRNGELLNATRRDYQVSVIDCDFNLLANYRVKDAHQQNGVFSYRCENTVELENFSVVKSGQVPTFRWDFGVEELESDTLVTTSISDVVKYTYPDNGDYTIRLTVETENCEDEYQYQVRIRSAAEFDLGEDEFYCKAFSKELDASSANLSSVLWSTGERRSKITVSDTGTYVATAVYGKCIFRDTVIFGLDSLPVIKLLEDTLICDEIDFDLQLEIEEPTDHLQFQWSTGDLDTLDFVNIKQAGDYSVVVRNGFCKEEKAVSIRQPVLPLVEDTFFCQSFLYRPELLNVPDVVYRWSNGVGGTTSVFNEAGTYWVEAEQEQCVSRDSFTITDAEVVIDLGRDTHFCEDVSFLLDARLTDLDYRWSTGDTSSQILATSPGTYSLIVQNSFGCSSSDSLVISQSIIPPFSLGEDLSICVNSPVIFTGPEGYFYEWSDGSTDQSIEVSKTGDYVLTVFDEFACELKDSITVTVDENTLPNKLYFANAFTPNGDQLNDKFPFQEEVIQPGYFVNIYNRWGEKVFDSRESESTNWDGIYLGVKASQGAYIYYATYRGCDGGIKSSKGTVTLLR